MAEQQHAEAPKQPERARAAQVGELDAQSRDLVLQRTAAAGYRQARRDPRALTPATLLALQRTAGNAAVNRLLQRARAQPAGAEPGRVMGRDSRPSLQPAGLLVQRLSEDQVKNIFNQNITELVSWSDVFKGKKPPDAVVRAIAARTTAYEDSSPLGKHARQRAVQDGLARLVSRKLQHLQEHAMMGPQPKHATELETILANAAEWGAAVDGLIEQVQRHRASLRIEAKNAIVANKNRPGPIPLGERVLIQCAMGQGVAADLHKFILHSEDFSSCTAIVLYNAHNGMGGLFHFAAGFKTTKEQTGELTKLYARVQPTEIHIDERSTRERSPRTMLRMALGDFTSLVGFFRGNCGFSGHIVQEPEHGGYFAYLNAAAPPRLEIGPSVKEDDKAVSLTNPLLNLTDTHRLPFGVANTGAVTMVHHQPSYDDTLSK